MRATTDAQGEREWTALRWASTENRRMEVVKVLVEIGANPVVASREGNTALDTAKFNGYSDSITILEVSPEGNNPIVRLQVLRSKAAKLLNLCKLNLTFTYRKPNDTFRSVSSRDTWLR